MEVTTGLLCDFAQVREGLLFVASGGVTRLYRPTLPAPMGLCCAIVVTLDQIELERPHEFQLVIMDEDGTRLAEAQGGFQVDAASLSLFVGERQQVPIAIDLRDAGVGAHGAHTLVVYIDGNRAWDTTFYVMSELAGPPV